MMMCTSHHPCVALLTGWTARLSARQGPLPQHRRRLPLRRPPLLPPLQGSHMGSLALQAVHGVALWHWHYHPCQQLAQRLQQVAVWAKQA